jgi:putative membrane protein
VTWSALITLVVGLAAVTFLVAAGEPAEIFRLLGTASWGMLAVIALRPPQIVFAALGWAPLVDGPRRPAWAALVRMRWIRDSVNALLPVAQVGGDFVRVHLLIRRGVGTALAAASVAVDLATELAAQFVFAAIGVAVLQSLPHQGQAAADWASAAAALCGAMALGFLAAQRWGLFRLVDRLIPKLTGRASSPAEGADMPRLHESVLRLHRAPRRMWLSGAAHLVSWLLGTLEAWAALRILGVEAGLAEALVIESLGQLARSLGFMVPGALGVQEGGLVLACGLFGVPPEQAIAFALVRRIRDVAFATPGLVAWRWEAMTDARVKVESAAGMAKEASPR